MEIVIALTIAMVFHVVAWALWLAPTTALIVSVGILMVGVLARVARSGTS